MPTSISSIIVPSGGAKWPALEDIYLRGGYRVVANIAARDTLYSNSQSRGTLKAGTLVLTLDTLQLWRYTGVAGSLWVEFLTNNVVKDDKHTHVQTEPAIIWDIAHNKSCRYFVYSLFDESGFSFIPDSIQIIDENNIRIIMLEPVAGHATLSFDM